jgi:hypothetical protein
LQIWQAFLVKVAIQGQKDLVRVNEIEIVPSMSLMNIPTSNQIVSTAPTVKNSLFPSIFGDLRRSRITAQPLFGLNSDPHLALLNMPNRQARYPKSGFTLPQDSDASS